MKKRILFILTVTMTVLGMSLAGCSSSDNKANQETTEASAEAEEKTEAAKQPEEGTRVAKDGADMQTEDPSMPTRIPMEGGTKINMYFGDTLITGVLNDSETAKALIEKLPITQHVSIYSHDF